MSIGKNNMKQIEKIFDSEYIKALFYRKVMPFYPEFKEIKNLEIIPYKKHIWEGSYHIVVEIRTDFIDDKGEEQYLPIFMTAHSHEPRRNVYDALEFLWENGFAGEHLAVPRPLFYHEYLNATFYRGVTGHNLHYYLENKNLAEIEMVVAQSAKWFAKLHAIKKLKNYIFNSENSRIRTVIPGVDKILFHIAERYPHYAGFYERAYGIFIKNEEDFFNTTKKRWLIHGDAHPENIIKMSDIKIAAIDFTDMSVADFTRDLGCFLQQFEYMSTKCELGVDNISRIKQVFLDNYFANSKEKYNHKVQDRIDNYYNWTMMRTITYLLLSGVIKRDAERLEKINNTINSLRDNLGI
jgi:thiamine kinase-like enzyme